MDWPYNQRTTSWLRRRQVPLMRWPHCYDCAQAGRGEVVACEVIAIGSGLISVCARCGLRRRRTSAV